MLFADIITVSAIRSAIVVTIFGSPIALMMGIEESPTFLVASPMPCIIVATYLYHLQ